MISRIQVKNFKCLLDVDVPLGPFNVLIGPNDSGKSSLLQAIKLLGETTRQPFAQVFSQSFSIDNLVWRGDQSRVISWKVQGNASNNSFNYRLALAPGEQVAREEELLINGSAFLNTEAPSGGIVQGTLPRFNQGVPFQAGNGSTGFFVARNQIRHSPNILQFDLVSKALCPIVEYLLDPASIRTSFITQATPAPTAVNGTNLSTRGDNLVSILDAIMTSPRRSDIINLERDLQNAIKTLSGISLPIQQQKKSLAFTLAGNESEPVSIPAALASDGALLITAFLALAYGNGPEIIFIDEPENGLHYSLLKLAMELLRKISTGEVGNQPRQVILTTHSPLLLNFAKPEEVRVFSRPEDGATRVAQMDQVANIQPLLKEFGLGELWFQLGEERLVEKVLAS
jgi:predicted ATPase